jgi:hypothetical protein
LIVPNLPYFAEAGNIRHFKQRRKACLKCLKDLKMTSEKAALLENTVSRNNGRFSAFS